MDETRITARIESLRKEIDTIQDLEQRYRAAEHHSRADRMAHASRELRLVEIRADLDQLKKPRTA